MSESKLIVTTRELITAYYDLGNVSGILEAANEQIVAYGTKSLRYAVGSKAVESLLKHELAMVTPCHLEKLKLQELVSGNGATVTASVILRIPQAVPFVMHRLAFMYTKQGRSYTLNGIHIVKDLRYAATYKAVSSRMMNAKSVPDDLHDQTHLRQIVDLQMDTAYFEWQTEPEYKLTYFTDGLWRLLGYKSAEQFTAACSKDMLVAQIDDEQQQQVCEAYLQLVSSGQESYQAEYRVKKADGSYIWVLECGHCRENADGTYRYTSILVNMMPLRRVSENLAFQVAYDDLTKIYNKESFCQKAQELINNNPKMNFEIMQMDIRRFKVINDLFGEETSDEILKYIADFFIQASIPNCIYGRLHADRFLLCYPIENNNRENFIKSLRVLATSFTIAYRIELCFGVYTVFDRTLPINLMCDRAGLALAKAKRNGLLICGEYTDDMRRDIVNEQKIVNHMDEALRNGEFTIYMQPKFELMTERITGAEALVRWVSPKRGCISPGEFVPVFENNGFIFKLDQYVWRKACEWQRQWIDKGNMPLPVSVNVSRVDLYSTELVDIFTDLVKEYNIDPSLFELEITESAYMDNPQQIIATVKELQKNGFKILMDDFGSGYSSLNMLKDLPVDILKLDLAFLDSQDETGRGGNILNSIVRMAKWLRIPVICEGVENRRQAEFLRTIGCNWAQGYYYSKPVPIVEYEQMLKVGTAPDKSSKGVWLDVDNTEEILNPNMQLNLIFNSIGGGIGLYEFDGMHLELLRANNGYFELFHEKTDILNDAEHNMLEKIPEEDWPIIFSAVHEATESGKTQTFILRRRIDGERILWVEVRLTIITTNNDSQLFYMAFTDVSAQHLKNEQLRTITEKSNCGVGFYEIRDGKMFVLYLNHWLYEINGINEEEFMKQTQGHLGTFLGERWEKQTVKNLIDCYAKKQPMYYEYPFDSPTGKFHWLAMTANIVLQEGDVYYCVAIIQDITDHIGKSVKQMDEVID